MIIFRRKSRTERALAHFIAAGSFSPDIMASFLRRKCELVNQAEATVGNDNNLENHNQPVDQGPVDQQHDRTQDVDLATSVQPLQSSSIPGPSTWTDKLKEYAFKLRHGISGSQQSQQHTSAHSKLHHKQIPKPKPPSPTIPKPSLVEAARSSNILLEHDTTPALSPSDVKDLDGLGLDRKLATVIAFKIGLDEDRECSQNDQYSYLIHELLDALAVWHKITRCKRFAGTWIGCVGFFHAWENPRQDSYHALVFASEAMFLASNLQLHLCCAVESGKVDGGILRDSPFFDMFGSEIRWILKMVETKKTGVVLVGNFARNLNSRPCRDVSGERYPPSYEYLPSTGSSTLVSTFPLTYLPFLTHTPHPYFTLTLCRWCVSDTFVQFTKIVGGSVWGVKTDREKVYVLSDMTALVPPFQAALLVRRFLLNEPRMVLGVTSILNLDTIRELTGGGKYGYGQGVGLENESRAVEGPSSSSSSSPFVSKSSSSCHHASLPSMTWQALQRTMEACSPLDCR